MPLPALSRLPEWHTHRRFEVGADATDARTDRPGSDGPIEPENALALLIPSGLLSRELGARSGSAAKYCDDAETPGAVSVADWLSTDEEEGS
jgi:hypothetical protein